MNGLSFLSSWLKDIVVLFILITIAELIMPKGNMKKYINMVIGLLIIFTIISPITKLINSDYNFEQAVMNYSKTEIESNVEIKEFNRQQDKLIEKVLKDRISEEITELIHSNTDYSVINIKIGIVQDKTNVEHIVINFLEIIIEEKTLADGNNKIQIEKIETVEFNDKIKDESEDVHSYNEIKELIYNKLSVEKESINIKTNNKGKGE